MLSKLRTARLLKLMVIAVLPKLTVIIVLLKPIVSTAPVKVKPCSKNKQIKNVVVTLPPILSDPHQL